MHDRAMQALYLLALDPIAETVGDPNSYGFRTERSTADAIEQYFNVLAPEACAAMDFGGRHPGLLRFCILMPPSRTRETCQRSHTPVLVGENLQAYRHVMQELSYKSYRFVLYNIYYTLIYVNSKVLYYL
jgi:hypothetical protein